ncbi:MAG: hypothetical protein NT088_00310 [Candidatus Omnitrophica bacterium]|nr:hypothetical protein [Candidatus Omnitrophota bacterium]
MKRAVFLLFFAFILVYGCSRNEGPVVILDAKIASSVDENFMPVKVTNNFPKGTATVACWIKWRAAKINTPVYTKWHYVTDDLPVKEVDFVTPRKEGSGSVSLAMPEGKALPSGNYRVDIRSATKLLKTLTFKVE